VILNLAVLAGVLAMPKIGEGGSSRIQQPPELPPQVLT
jgi:hypothetical protein